MQFSLPALLFAWFGNWVFADTAKGINYFYLIPHNKGITSEPFWQAGVDYMVSNWRLALLHFKYLTSGSGGSVDCQ